MFEFFYWSSIVDALNKLPKETVAVVAGAYVVLDIHKRNTQVKVAKANAQTRVAELEVEALRLKLQLQQNEPCLKPVQ